ncbi:hypothetical protein J7E88_14395 [Streptomyces sp. ISL-10]|uniref:hypothetical protein n=1 Tax=Streptomyces sp. ISL-10 TaxID=2819172 RepID=UPI001BE55EE4|nr:hypothetical protein [Streptomyces sp. ISL-10]MBT2366464.1 hypothetical protein [Streptomyces sp. ISL-10]
MSGPLWQGPGRRIDTLPVLPRQRGGTAADPMDALADRLHDMIAAAVHPDEIAAVLESDGMTDDHIRLTYGRPDSFTLAEELYAKVPRAHPEPPGPPADPWRVSLLGCLLRGLVFALPGLAYVPAAPQLAGADLAPLLAGALTGWMWNQALSHRAYSWLALGDRAAAVRCLRAGAPAGAVLGTAAALLFTGPGQWPSAVFSAAQSLYLSAATALLVLGRERALLCCLLPLPAGTVLVLLHEGVPLWARTGLLLVPLTASLTTAALTLRTRATPQGRKPASGRSGAGARDRWGPVALVAGVLSRRRAAAGAGAVACLSARRGRRRPDAEGGTGAAGSHGAGARCGVGLSAGLSARRRLAVGDGRGAVVPGAHPADVAGGSGGGRGEATRRLTAGGEPIGVRSRFRRAPAGEGPGRSATGSPGFSGTPAIERRPGRQPGAASAHGAHPAAPPRAGGVSGALRSFLRGARRSRPGAPPGPSAVRELRVAGDATRQERAPGGQGLPTAHRGGGVRPEAAADPGGGSRPGPQRRERGSAPRLLASLPHGLFGLGVGVLVLYTALGDVLGGLTGAVVAAPSAVALTVSMGPAEWLLHRFRSESLAGLRASTTARAFWRTAATVLAKCLAGYLAVLFTLALAGTLLWSGAPGLGGVRLVTLLLIGTVLWTGLLLQSFGAVTLAAGVCCAAALVQTAALVTGAAGPRTAGLAVAAVAAAVLVGLVCALLGRATAHRV